MTPGWHVHNIPGFQWLSSPKKICKTWLKIWRIFSVLHASRLGHPWDILGPSQSIKAVLNQWIQLADCRLNLAPKTQFGWCFSDSRARLMVFWNRQQLAATSGKHQEPNRGPHVIIQLIKPAGKAFFWMWTPRKIEYKRLRVGKNRDDLAPKCCTLEMKVEPHMSERIILGTSSTRDCLERHGQEAQNSWRVRCFCAILVSATFGP